MRLISSLELQFYLKLIMNIGVGFRSRWTQENISWCAALAITYFDINGISSTLIANAIYKIQGVMPL